MFKIASVMLLAAFTAACQSLGATNPNFQAAQAKLQKVKEDCDDRTTSGEFKTAVDHAKCMNDGEASVLVPLNPYPDLLTLKQSYRIALAKRVDDHVLSPEDAALQFAQATSQIVEEANRREAESRQLGAEEATARAAQSEAFSNLMQRIAPPTRTMITCNRFGNTTTCF